MLMMPCTLVQYSVCPCYFASRFNSSDNEKVDNDPGQQEAECHSRVNANAMLINGRWNVQCLTEEKILCWTGNFTLLNMPCMIGVQWTLSPWQYSLCTQTHILLKMTYNGFLQQKNIIRRWRRMNLKGMKKVPEAPGINYIIIQTQICRSDDTCETYGKI